MPSPCTKVVDLLADYLEARLPAGVRVELDRHLEACPACVAQVQTYRSTVALLRSLRDEDLPRELRSSLQTFLDRGSAN